MNVIAEVHLDDEEAEQLSEFVHECVEPVVDRGHVAHQPSSSVSRSLSQACSLQPLGHDSWDAINSYSGLLHDVFIRDGKHECAGLAAQASHISLTALWMLHRAKPVSRARSVYGLP